MTLILPLPVTQEQMEYLDLVKGPGTAQKAIEEGKFRIVPGVHGLFPNGGTACRTQ
jgi:hypothetical protein